MENFFKAVKEIFAFDCFDATVVTVERVDFMNAVFQLSRDKLSLERLFGLGENADEIFNRLFEVPGKFLGRVRRVLLPGREEIRGEKLAKCDLGEISCSIRGHLSLFLLVCGRFLRILAKKSLTVVLPAPLWIQDILAVMGAVFGQRQLKEKMTGRWWRSQISGSFSFD